MQGRGLTQDSTRMRTTRSRHRAKQKCTQTDLFMIFLLALEAAKSIAAVPVAAVPVAAKLAAAEPVAAAVMLEATAVRVERSLHEHA
jgi:hypothetical protein